MHMFLQRCKSSRVNSILWLLLFPFLLTLAPFGAFAQNRLLSRHVPSATSQSRAIEHLSNESRLNLAISLPLRNQKELDALVADVSDPASSHYRHYWTPDQFAAKFGPTPKDYQALTEFARTKNLTITGTHSNRLVLAVSGTTADIERAFNVKIMIYQHPTRGSFYAPDSEPTVDFGVPIEHVAGLDNFTPPRPMNLKAKPLTDSPPNQTGSGPGGLLFGTDFRAAYAADVTQTGLGQSLAVVEFDGFNPDDVSYNFGYSGINPVPVQTVLLDGFTGTPGGASIEVVLDIMMASYMAPGLQSVISYEGCQPDDILNRIATDDIANQVSSSWGFGIDATTEQIFKQFIIQGQSFLQASGDDGMYTGMVMTPSDDPNVTVVGGTDLYTAGAGGPWSSEDAWTGSGGGVSTVYPIPSYQQGVSMVANGGSTTMRNLPDVAAVGGSGIFLICFDGQGLEVDGTSAAAPLWAGFVALANQEAQTNGRAPVGFLNPSIYALGNGNSYSTDFHDVSTGNNGFAAVSGYDLATGWGSPTGQSLVDALSQAGPAYFTIGISNSTLTLYQSNTANTTVSVHDLDGFTGVVNFTTSGLPSGVNASFSPASTATTTLLTFSANRSAAPGTYNVAVTGTLGSISCTGTVQIVVTQPTLTIAASLTNANLVVGGPSVTSTISVSNAIGFTGNVTLSASGAPSGLRVSFSATPISVTGTSVVTFAPNAAVKTGLFTVRITGTSGRTTGSVLVQLNIQPPPVVATPAFSITPGTYTKTQTVSISDSTTGAAIYYTTNGATPTASSSKYTGVVTVNSSETLKAIATASGYSASAVASAAYTITPPAATPAFSVTPGTYTTTRTVSISDSTPGAAIYYTTNGATPTANSTKYTGAVIVNSTETLKAIATASGYSASAVASAAYTITPPAAIPSFSPGAGSYAIAQSVTISDATSGATIYYTTNGSTPTASSSKYTGAVTVKSTETLKAIAIASAYTNSSVASASYTIKIPN
jgi:subtilase family serine protease